MIHSIRGVILDMDGTLIDSMGIWHEIDKQFFEENHLTAPENISNLVNKMTMQEWAEFFIREFHMNLTTEQIIQRIGEICYEYYRDIIAIKPFVTEFLDFFDESHIPYGIATATYRDSAHAVLKRLGILNRMQFILTADDVPSSKKTPEMFLKSAELLGEHPEQILVVDDALHCIRTAVSAGFVTAAVYDPSVPADEWSEMTRISRISGMNLHEILLKFS